jgi:4-alpha-glucanotransferase
MANDALDDLALNHGIALEYEAQDGKSVAVSDEAKQRVLAALGVEIGCTNHTTPDALMAVVARPQLRPAVGKRCFVPDWLKRRPAWGVSLQLYELRSRRNWGIGDFADLAAFCRTAASWGADFVGVNPLHALFTADPWRCSPFSPSNRLFLNPLYIAVDQAPGYSAADGDEARLVALRDSELIDYAGVRDAKFAALRQAWKRWRSGAEHEPAPQEFEAFKRARGAPLRRHAFFEVLSWHMHAQAGGAGWRSWLEPFRDVGSPEVHWFADEHFDEVDFHEWLQWIAHRQLRHASEEARRAGMRIGLYLDFAVGEAPDGSATWSDPRQFVRGMSVGAPPDLFSADGQDWGLAALSPIALRNTGFARYRELASALMRDAGALRIDHAMSIWQLFLVPERGRPADGTYLRYPVQELLSMLAEESQRNETVVIGEDLGTVPTGFREVMQQSGILSYRVLYFEQRDGKLIPPRKYPRLALACLSTHDLATFAGWWSGNDIELRLKHGLIEKAQAVAQRQERAGLRASLLDLMKPELSSADRLAAMQVDLPPPTNLVSATHRLMARTPSLLAAVRLADLCGEVRPTNVPGTTDSYPNWRIKLPVTIEALAEQPLCQAIVAAVAKERPK